MTDSRYSAEIEQNTLVQDETLGMIKGKILENGASAFYGVPFSLPPIGENRWRKPRPWTDSLGGAQGYFDATFKRPACPQLCSLPSPEYTCPYDQSEDCLHLTIHVPSTAVSRRDNKYHEIKKDSKLVVMVFIHGGAYISGSNSILLYDGRFFAEKGNVVLVNVNYRLGPFGFFYQDSKGSDAITGNFGLWDQIEALRWVQKHISSFGGDPNEVTIFGQSAGGQSVLSHLVNGYSDKLFKRAIAESGPFGITFKTIEEAQTTSDNFVKENGKCVPNDVGCLRKLSSDEILETLANFSIGGQLNVASLSQVAEPWAFILDHDILHEQLYYTYLKNEQQQKPLVWGATSDEGMFFVAQISSEPMSEELFNIALRLIFEKEDIEAITAHLNYQCMEPNCDYRYPFNDLVTEYMFICPTRYTMMQNRQSGLTPNIWWYHFTQAWSFPEFWEEYDECYDLPCHSADLPYIFALDVLTNFRFTEKEQYLSDTMIKYWTNFAKSGDPNHPAEDTYWPKLFGRSSNEETNFDMVELTGEGVNVFTGGLAERCDFWDELGLYLNDSIKIGLRSPEDFKKKLYSLVDGNN